MDFQNFLTAKLKERKIDVSVYLSYLMGILEDTLEEDERRENLLDILASLLVSWIVERKVHSNVPSAGFKLLTWTVWLQESGSESLVDEIITKWNASHTAPTGNSTPAKQGEVDIAELLKTTTNISLQNSSQRSRQLTDEEKRIKEQILASYSQTETQEEDEAENDYDNDEGDPDLEKNTNKSDVQKLAREKREQAKLDSEQKKLKDKEDRAKQKSSKEDKKKARQSAAVKGERKRWSSQYQLVVIRIVSQVVETKNKTNIDL